MLLVPFGRTFSPAEQDRKLLDKLRAELGGIFIWSLQGLCLLAEHGGFIEPAACRAAQDDYRRDCDPARAFLQENYQVNPAESVPTARLYEHYTSWCQDNGFQPLNSRNFGKTLRRVFPNVVRRQRKETSKRFNAYVGIVRVGDLE